MSKQNQEVTAASTAMTSDSWQVNKKQIEQGVPQDSEIDVENSDEESHEDDEEIDNNKQEVVEKSTTATSKT